MTDSTLSLGNLRHVAGLAAVVALTGLCYLVWQNSSEFVAIFGLPELRILAAIGGAILLLSLAEFVTSRLR